MCHAFINVILLYPQIIPIKCILFPYFSLWKLRVIKILSVVSQLGNVGPRYEKPFQICLAVKPSSCLYMMLNCRHQPLAVMPSDTHPRVTRLFPKVIPTPVSDKSHHSNGTA